MRFDQVSLATLQRTQRQIEGRCFECDAVLRVDLRAVIAAHGKTATLAKVGYTILCPVCEAAGLFLRDLPKPRGELPFEEQRAASHFGGPRLSEKLCRRILNPRTANEKARLSAGPLLIHRSKSKLPLRGRADNAETIVNTGTAIDIEDITAAVNSEISDIAKIAAIIQVGRTKIDVEVLKTEGPSVQGPLPADADCPAPGSIR